MTVGNRIGRARFHAIPAEDTARIVDVVDAGVPLTRRNAIRINILRGFNINAIRGACGCAKKTSHALLQAAFVTMQHMNPSIAWLEMYRLVGIVLGYRLPKHIPERDAEPLRQSREGLSNFANDGRHGQSLTNRDETGNSVGFGLSGAG